MPLQKKERRPRNTARILRAPFFISLAVIFVLVIFLFAIPSINEFIFTSLHQNKPIKHELALVFQPNIVRINFDFDSAQEEVYSVNFNKLDLARFKVLGFSVRKARYEDFIILRLEFANAANEKSVIYLSGIPAYRWQEYRIHLTEFKDIHNWSEIAKLSFVVDERSTNHKKGIVYIDNIRLLR